MIAIYARVSTQEQAVNGHSIGEQVERMRKYCEAMGWNEPKEYIDAGFSGAKTDRPALKRLISDIKGHQIEKVLVYKLDRLSRSQKDTLWIIEDIILANGADFVSISENFDTSTPLGRAMVGILAVFAQLEREQIKERMKMGKEARAKKGLFCSSRPPIGYDLIDGELIVNEYEKTQIQRAFDEFISGKSYSQIAKGLNDDGFSHKYGSWNYITLRFLISHRIYIGEVSYGGEWHKGSHTPIIPEKTFNLAQKRKNDITTAYKEKHARYGKIGSYLGGLMWCKCCGQKYSKTTVHQYVYYSCPSRVGKRPDGKKIKCHNKNWRMDELNNLVFDEIRKLSLEDYTPTPKEDKTPAIKAQIAKIDKQIEKMVELYSTDGMPLNVLQSKIHELNDKRSALEGQLVVDEHMTKEDAAPLVASFGEVLDQGNLGEVHALLESLIDKIELDGENVTIFWNFD